jgi:hypothetical protein
VTLVVNSSAFILSRRRFETNEAWRARSSYEEQYDPFTPPGTGFPFRSLLRVRVRVRVTLQLTVSQSVCLGVEPNLGLLTREFFFLKLQSCLIWGALSDERSGLSFVNRLSL